jgi:acyl-CoA dehydrogenase
MTSVLWILLAFAVMVALAYSRAPIWTWSAAALLVATVAAGAGATVVGIALFMLFTASLPLNFDDVRRKFLSDPVFKWFKRALPPVSETEQEAIDAGTVWWDGELFGGRPDWEKLLATPKTTLSAEERAFLDGPVEELCRMLDDWEIVHELNDLPREVWQFIKEKGFLGMIIPKEYGGLDFSALAHSQVVMKLASRSGAGCVSVMVPNSLGPAELLLHYGTEEQKRHLLPRLAQGLEMPCFALTGPEAGSDAGSIPDRAIVCLGEFEGRKDVLGMRVTWEKRYITLGPIATILGLAFKLYDPDHLLGDKEELGITLALIPTRTPGVNIGRRHAPLNAAFHNGPNSGRDVFIPIDWVIGGRERVGQGWRMLMECLAAGRSISLPASSTGSAKLAARATGAYSRVRVQFKTPIGRFEGVEEALARIGGNVYMMDSARIVTAGAIDLGEKPSVISAIVKYHLTERGRQVINDAMDVHGGKGICLGPSNYLGRTYQQIPIGITVEGANILTRSLIIFGQGAIRGHPYVLKEIALSREPDPERAAKEFDETLCDHVKFTYSNGARALVMGLTGSRFVGVPGAPELRRYYQHLTRFSAAFALAADVAMLYLGGDLKLKEKLSARLGDILSQLYLCSTALKRYEDDGRQKQDLPFIEWGLQDGLYRIQEALDGVLRNFPSRLAALMMRFLVFPFGRRFAPPSDTLGHNVARLLMEPGLPRYRLTAGMYLPKEETEPVGRLDLALECAVEAEPIEAKIRSAVRSGILSEEDAAAIASQALEKGVITLREAETLKRLEGLRRGCIMVDDFPPDFGARRQEHEATPGSASDNQKTSAARKTA